MAKDYPEIECEFLLDNEAVAGRFLLLEIANMAFIGPNLELFPRPDPSDGWLDVVWIESERRNHWRRYLQLCGRGEEAIAPANSRRCQRIYIHYTDASAHIDSKVFSSLVTPVSIRLECSALHLVDLRFTQFSSLAKRRRFHPRLATSGSDPFLTQGTKSA
jgi:hypothetical protein